MPASTIRPDAFAVETKEDSSEVRLVWSRDTGEHQVVVIERNQLQQVLLQIQSEIEPGRAVPINLASLRAGTTIAVTGLGFGPRPDHFLLTAYVDLPEQGRGVTVPLRFSKKDVQDCVQMMTRWLDK